MSDLLPLDLHVLGLPLAFILSQDQTLHSQILTPRTVARRSFFTQGSHFLSYLALFLSMNFCGNRKNNHLPASLSLFPSFGDCKDTTTFLARKTFFKKSYPHSRKASLPLVFRAFSPQNKPAKRGFSTSLRYTSLSKRLQRYNNRTPLCKNFNIFLTLLLYTYIL